MIEQLALSGGIESAGLPALRVPFTIAAIVLIAAGFFIVRRRQQFFDPDLRVDNDTPAVRHTREELIIFVWGGLTLVLLSILYQTWRA